jgi:tRNA pseudouridine32 synthase/23S rRNA pseudouridine746 synthase
MTPEELSQRLLYRDGLILVIDKPAGIAVHKGPKGGESLEDSFSGLRFGLPRNPALAHRLDRATSGCLVLGRHRKALEKLGILFKNGKIAKTYWALVEGGPQADEGMIDLALGRRDATRGWWMKVDPQGLPARTRWRVLGRGTDAAGKKTSFLALEPETGRTHQLRVHCAVEGWPIAGDSIYGPARRDEAGEAALQLHARSLVIPLYSNKDPIWVQAPLPAHFVAALAACGLPALEHDPEKLQTFPMKSCVEKER